MSHDYDVIVPQERWPTAREFQAVLDSHGASVELQGIDNWDAPLPTDWEPEFPVTLAGRPVGFEVYVYQIKTTTKADREGKTELIEALEEHGMESSRVVDGSYVFSVALRHGEDEWESARQLMSALVRSCDGYGFEFQAGTAGGLTWADALEDTLASGKQQYDRIVQEIAARPANHPAAEAPPNFWGRITGFLKK